VSQALQADGLSPDTCVRPLGLDLTSGQRPSMMAMMKLAGDAELKEAITNVKSAMDKAGVELSAQVRRCLLACMVIWLT
jgi:preprotein translocase subunit SecD